MRIRSMAIVILSVVLSVVATLMVDRNIKREASDTVRAKKIELVDNQGNVRGSFQLRAENGKSEPELVLLDDSAQEAVTLSLSSNGKGRLTFRIPAASGLGSGYLRLGYLILDDSTHQNSETGWGLIIRNNERTSTLMGISDTGKLWGISAHPQ